MRLLLIYGLSKAQRYSRRISAMLLVLCIFAAGMSEYDTAVFAAGRFSVSKKKVVIAAGKKMSIKYTSPGNIKVSSSRKRIVKAKVRKKYIVINAIKFGKACIKVKWGRKNIRISVTVYKSKDTISDKTNNSSANRAMALPMKSTCCPGVVAATNIPKPSSAFAPSPTPWMYHGEPASTSVPEATMAPATNAPQTSARPEYTRGPTRSPDPSREPSPTQQPTNDPDATLRPAPTLDPYTTASPEPTLNPDATVPTKYPDEMPDAGPSKSPIPTVIPASEVVLDSENHPEPTELPEMPYAAVTPEPVESQGMPRMEQQLEKSGINGMDDTEDGYVKEGLPDALKEKTELEQY